MLHAPSDVVERLQDAEEVGVVVRACGEHLAVGRDDLGFDKVVAREAVLAVQTRYRAPGRTTLALTRRVLVNLTISRRVRHWL